MFEHGLDLPCFASFPLLDDPDAVAILRRYFEEYLELARAHDAGFLVDTLTWRASRDWGTQLGYSPEQIAEFNRRSVAFAEELRASAPDLTVVIAGCVGPRGDAYRPDALMSAAKAERYHAEQIGTLADTSVDLVSAMTLTYAEEAIGIARAAKASRVPVAISFTVETDGRLPSGEELGEAIGRVDAETDGAPAYFMVNCAHPTHFEHLLDASEGWLDRIAGIRANASTRSHVELDEADELDAGDPDDLAARYVELRSRLPRLTVAGGCCGTDVRHVTRIANALLGE